MRLIAFLLLLVPAISLAQSSFDGVIRAELGFAQLNKDQGFVNSFTQYADEKAIWFNPHAENALKSLVEMKAKGEAGKPSQLRWYPHFIGISQSGDFGFDYGPYYIDGKDDKGMFFTIWHKDEKGDWRFLLDIGAANLKAVGKIPQDKDYDFLKSVISTKTARFSQDMKLNLNLANDQMAALTFAKKNTIFSNSNQAPSDIGGDKSKIIEARPKGDWVNLGQFAARSNDLIATYGEVKNNGKPVGNYVRLWQVRGAKYYLIIDIYQPIAT